MELKKKAGQFANTLTDSDRATHMYVIGGTGVGKSRQLLSMLLQDVSQGRGTGLIDPHTDLFEDALSYIAQWSEKHPEIADRVVILDPTSKDRIVGFNPLEPSFGILPERKAFFLSDTLVKVWRIDPLVAARMVRLLLYTFLALSELGLTIVEFPRFLRDVELRTALLKRIQNEDVREYFSLEFPKVHRDQTEWMQSSLNKVGTFAMDRDIRLIFGQQRSTINFREIMDGEKILLVNLAKGKLGHETSQLLGAFIVAQIQQAALARVDSLKRPPFYLYLDEFQNYTTDNIQEILAESRKYGLSLILAHQYLRQVPEMLRAAVLSTAGTLMAFRVGYEDGNILAREIFSPNIDAQRHRLWNLPFLPEFPLPLGDLEFRPLDTEWERYTLALTRLQNREFWVKRKGPYAPQKFRAYTIPRPERSDRIECLRRNLMERSGRRYGRPKAEVLDELLAERPRLLKELSREFVDVSDYEEV